MICLLLLACNCVVSIRGGGGLLFSWVLGIGYAILLRQLQSLPYNYSIILKIENFPTTVFVLFSAHAPISAPKVISEIHMHKRTLISGMGCHSRGENQNLPQF